jgi:glyoxylase-like metal-dependent hydrolase (beta-lactamase superfamily II)
MTSSHHRAPVRGLAFAFACVVCLQTVLLFAQASRVPAWDARGVGPLPVQGITSLDVAADGSSIIVGTIAPTGTPNVHVLDRDGKLVKSYVVNQRWIQNVASAAGNQALALCTMTSGSAFDEPGVFACGEKVQPIAGGTGGFSFFHYGDHSNHTGKLLRSYPGGAVTTNENQLLWLDATATVPQQLATPKANAPYRNLKPTALTAHKSGVAALGGYANYPAADGVKAPNPTNNLFLYKPGTPTPIWSRPTVSDVAPSTPPEPGEYGRPLLADGSRKPLPQRDDAVFAPLSIAFSREAEFSPEKSRIAVADYRGYQRTVKSSATGLNQVIGTRFMPAQPTITVYDGAGKVVRRFDPQKFEHACWVDLAFLPGGKRIIAYPHAWASRGLAGQAMLPADDKARTLWVLDVETGNVIGHDFADAISSLAITDSGDSAVSCWNGRIYGLDIFEQTPEPQEGIDIGAPATLAFDEAGQRWIAATTSGEVLFINAQGKVEKSVDLNKESPYVEQWYTKKATAAKLANGLWELPGGRVESDLGGQRVIEAPDGLILIEGHAGLSFEREWKGIETAGLDPRKVKYVLTTHEHGDHSPGAYLWRVVTGAQFICSREMAYTLQHHLPDGTGYGLHPPVPVDIKLDEDEKPLDLAGMRINPIRLPGHTYGSMGWLFEKEGKRYVAIGDLIMPDGRLGYAGSINFSPYQVLESLRKLDSLRVDTILPGHGPVVGPDRYVAAGIAFGSSVGWGKMTPEKPNPRFRITQDNMLVTGFLAEATSAVFGDVDGDGLPDVAVVAPRADGSVVKVYLNKTEREPRFDPIKPDFEVVVPGIGPPKKIRLVMLNADKKADLAVFDSGNVALLASKDEVGQYDISRCDAQEAYQIRMLDRQPPQVGRPFVFGQFSGAHSVVRDEKTGKLRSEPLKPPFRTAYADIRELDLNSDGRTDWIFNDGSIRLRGADGKLPETPTMQLTLPGKGEWYHLGIGDFNGDNRPDIAIVEREGTMRTYYHTGDGEKPYAPQPRMTTQLKSPPPNTVIHARDAATVADWNGDGYDDLLFGMSQRDEVRVLLGTPQGLRGDRIETIKLDVLLHFEHSVKVADFNGDGRQDLGVFALVPGGPFTPYVWLRPEAKQGE